MAHPDAETHPATARAIQDHEDDLPLPMIAQEVVLGTPIEPHTVKILHTGKSTALDGNTLVKRATEVTAIDA